MAAPLLSLYLAWALEGRLLPLAPSDEVRSRMRLTVKLAVALAVADAAVWIPTVASGAWVVGALLLVLGPAAYAHALEAWCAHEGWVTAGRRFARARVALLAGAASSLALLAAFVGFAHPSHRRYSDFTPSALFGRPLHGTGVTVGFVAWLLIVWVGILLLRSAHRFVRAGLANARTEDPIATPTS